jgi:hypothetical protein
MRWVFTRVFLLLVPLVLVALVSGFFMVKGELSDLVEMGCQTVAELNQQVLKAHLSFAFFLQDCSCCIALTPTKPIV